MAPVADAPDPVTLLQAATRLGATRLVTLCELHLTKVIDRCVTERCRPANF